MLFSQPKQSILIGSLTHTVTLRERTAEDRVPQFKCSVVSSLHPSLRIIQQSISLLLCSSARRVIDLMESVRPGVASVEGRADTALQLRLVRLASAFGWIDWKRRGEREAQRRRGGGLRTACRSSLSDLSRSV